MRAMARDLLVARMGSADLSALEARARREIEMTAHPHLEWMEPRLYRGRPALDVLIVGAGHRVFASPLRSGATACAMSWQSTARPRAGKGRGSPTPACTPCAAPRIRTARTSGCPAWILVGWQPAEEEAWTLRSARRDWAARC